MFILLNQAKRLFCFFIVMSFFITGCKSHKPEVPQQRAPEVGVMTVSTQRVELTTELPGRTAAFRVADIRPQVNGIILKKAFEEGSIVKAGDLLYEIDPVQYQAAYNQAKAAVAMAESSLPAARLREQRFKELVTSRAVGEQDYDDALAALRHAEAQAEASKAALETAKINLSYTPIKAPISGKIGKSNVTEGALVTAYQATVLATVQQLDPIYIDVPQSTSELSKIKHSMNDVRFSHADKDQNKVKVIMENGESYEQEGTLEFHDTIVNPTTGSVVLRIVVSNPEGVFLPGMFVRAILKEGIIEEAILIPQSSVSRDQKGEPFVLIVGKNNQVEIRKIKIDRAIDDKWLISSGLNRGDCVIVDGIQRVRPGVFVTTV